MAVRGCPDRGGRLDRLHLLHIGSNGPVDSSAAHAKSEGWDYREGPLTHAAGRGRIRCLSADLLMEIADLSRRHASVGAAGDEMFHLDQSPPSRAQVSPGLLPGRGISGGLHYFAAGVRAEFGLPRRHSRRHSVRT